MRLGALLGPVAQSQNPQELAQQARSYAAEGFDSLWSAQAIGRGFMITDPFVTLAVAASVTEDVELGTAVLQLPLYHPVDVLVHHKRVNFPKVSRIPGLVDFDRISLT